MIRKLISRIFPNQVKLYNNFTMFKNEFAQYKSMKLRLPVDRNSDAIPWFTYPSIEYLSQFDYSNFEVLEFGMGNSTIFWAKRCKNITSIEHRKEWYEKINKELQFENTELVLKPESEYTSICTEKKNYDLIIIDGIKRTECAKNVSKCIKKDTGMVILDNSDWYPDTAKYLRDELRLIQVDFFGFGPINNYTWCTSVFLNAGTHLNPIKKQPVHGLGSVIQISDND